MAFVSITDSAGVLCTQDSLERNSDGNVKIEWQWYHSDKRLCANNNCQNAAKLQCMVCVKGGFNEEYSFFCSDECFAQMWQQHNKDVHIKQLQQISMSSNQRNPRHNRQLQGQQSELPPLHTLEWNDDDLPISDDTSNKSQYYHCRYPSPLITTWTTIGNNTRIYTPTKNDVGRMLRITCWPTWIHNNDTNNSSNNNDNESIERKVGKVSSIDTSSVFPLASPPPPRHLTYNPSLHQRNPINPFRVVCYNTLAPIYATPTIYPYTPSYSLTWEYRKNIILREILSYNADVICLQEVQTDHFRTFYQPRLNDAGYDGIFKAKTRDAPAWSIDLSTPGSTATPSIDGCATFYRRDRFVLLESHTIEFNEIVKRSGFQDKRILRRLMKGM